MATDRRRSRLRDGVVLLHADLHNHTMLSDGAGDPRSAFARLRAAGLDVAALTDHASIPRASVPHLRPGDYPDADALRLARLPPASIDAAGWALSAELADAADQPGEFTAIRGFEWTEPYVGHANVWFSESERDVHTPGRVAGLHDWLADAEPAALFGYNHPGREPGRFDGFVLDPRLVERMVGLELFNRTYDFGTVDGRSPLVDCLGAGWRPGLLGVSDEHGRDYGLPGKGRTGLWARENTRAGVREALLARASFATREPGLLLDATLGGEPAGATVPGDGDLELRVDVAGLDAARPPVLQLLAADPGGASRTVVVAETEAGAGEPVGLQVRGPHPPWLVLRVVDRRGGDGPDGRRTVAYASPWWPVTGAPVPE